MSSLAKTKLTVYRGLTVMTNSVVFRFNEIEFGEDATIEA